MCIVHLRSPEKEKKNDFNFSAYRYPNTMSVFNNFYKWNIDGKNTILFLYGKMSVMPSSHCVTFMLLSYDYYKILYDIMWRATTVCEVFNGFFLSTGILFLYFPSDHEFSVLILNVATYLYDAISLYA